MKKEIKIKAGGFYISHVKDLIEVRKMGKLVTVFNHTTDSTSWLPENRITVSKELTPSDLSSYKRKKAAKKTNIYKIGTGDKPLY